MERKTAYSSLAEWFEYLNDDCGYEQWSQYLIKTLSAYPLDTGLDVGCGGGYFTRALQRHGYQMTGMDISSEMLDKAQRAAFEEGVRSEYVLGDVSRGKIARRYSFVTAINDCFNYIPKQRLKAALKNVYGALRKGGVFLFDVSSEKKFRERFVDAVNVDDRDDVTYFSFARLDGDEATLDVTLYVKGEDGRYARFDERHTQYVYTESELTDALREVGFTVLRTEGHLGEEKTISDRLVFLAQK